MSEPPGAARVRRLAAAYLAGQGAAVAAWWAALAMRPEWRARLFPERLPEEALLAFLLPDLLLMTGASLAAAWLLAARRQAAPAAVWTAAGAVGYATLYTLALSWLMDGGWGGTLLMLASLLLTGAFALATAPPRRPLFRQARPAGVGWNLAKTLGQMIVFWTTLLLLVPQFIILVQRRLGLALLDGAGWDGAGAALFLACSLLGIRSAYEMARLGEGTPLPLDSPRRLVRTGPYARVRNPMAIAGLGQGLAVALITGSSLVALYVLLGGFLWQCVARPLEEDDLVAHFGGAYEAYRGRVRCWIPRLASGGTLPAVRRVR